MSVHHCKLRNKRAEAITFSTNADEGAEVQMVIASKSQTLFVDFTLKEADSVWKALGKAIKAETEHQNKFGKP